MQSWVIGNWKKNPATLAEVNELTTSIKSKFVQKQSAPKFDPTCYPQLMIAPSTIHLMMASQNLENTNILVGCQDISAESATIGAYTGDTSAQQMVNAGICWTLVGHSERRSYHQETKDTLITKMNFAFEQGLGVIFCIGETLDAYNLGKTIPVLEEQLQVLKSLPTLSKHFNKIIIAYEPVWSIGTGKVPSIEEVETAHQAIKQYITGINASLANTPILYGGSVNADNADQFAASKWVDGALVGGASLDADKFLSIADSFYKSKQQAHCV
ncbi:MAG: triose-phosphate isomerase [Gammaproteobacteria bacterium]|nr:MAG: triose-phosphate isomerase [Gammaproteobacteria bacterium]